MNEGTRVDVTVYVPVTITANSVTALQDLVRELKTTRITYDSGSDGSFKIDLKSVSFRVIKQKWLEAALRLRARKPSIFKRNNNVRSLQESE